MSGNSRICHNIVSIVILGNSSGRIYFSHIHVNTLNMMRLLSYIITAVYTVCLYSIHIDAVYLLSYAFVIKLVSKKLTS